MKKLWMGGLVLSASLLPLAAAPTYYQYNLAALGVANSDFTSATAGLVNGISGFSTGALNIGLAAKATDLSMRSDEYLSRVPFTINEGWSANKAAQSTSDIHGAPVSIDLAGEVNGATAVFLMLNTMWGQATDNITVRLDFEGGASETFLLRGNRDTRDYNGVGAFASNIDSSLRSSDGLGGQQSTLNESTTKASSLAPEHGQTLYRDIVVLYVAPSLRNSLLTNIHILDTGSDDKVGTWSDASRALLWGATVAVTSPAAIPEPSTWMLIAGGLGALALRRRRQ